MDLKDLSLKIGKLENFLNNNIYQIGSKIKSIHQINDTDVNMDFRIQNIFSLISTLSVINFNIKSITNLIDCNQFENELINSNYTTLKIDTFDYIYGNYLKRNLIDNIYFILDDFSRYLFKNNINYFKINSDRNHRNFYLNIENSLNNNGINISLGSLLIFKSYRNIGHNNGKHTHESYKIVVNSVEYEFIKNKQVFNFTWDRIINILEDVLKNYINLHNGICYITSVVSEISLETTSVLATHNNLNSQNDNIFYNYNYFINPNP